MVSRDRSRYDNSGVGSATYKGPLVSTVYNNSWRNNWGRIIDQVPGKDNSLTITKRSCSNPLVSNKYYLTLDGSQFKETRLFPLSFFNNGGSANHLSVPGRPTNAQLGVQLRSVTNPSRPKVDAYAFIFELRELPSLLFGAGLSNLTRVGGNSRKLPLPKQFAKNTIEWHFGWKPLVQDYLKLIDFAYHTQRRMHLLSRMRDEGSVIRKTKLWSGTAVETPNNIVVSNSAPSAFYSTHKCVSRSTTKNVWGYTKWSPSSSFRLNLRDDTFLMKQARGLALGINDSISFATIWQVLPWSWLADWFTDIGSWLTAHRNNVPITCDVIRGCETTSTEEVYVLESSNFGLEPGSHTCTVKLVTKSRFGLSAAFPSFDFDILSASQLNILANLAVLKYR